MESGVESAVERAMGHGVESSARKRRMLRFGAKGGPQCIRLVWHYKHVGGLVDCIGSLHREAEAKAGGTRPSFFSRTAPPQPRLPLRKGSCPRSEHLSVASTNRRPYMYHPSFSRGRLSIGSSIA